MGIQISGLLSNQAFDWKSVVDQLIAADSIPITTLQTQQKTNTDQVTALAAVQTSLQAVQDSIQSIRTGNVFAARTVSSDTANTTWQSSSVTGAPLGSYKFAVSQLATAAQLKGATNISSTLAPTSDVSGLTLASMRTATAVSAGTFSVNGHTVTVALTDSLQDVFDKISAADPSVTASYDPTGDGITLSQSSGELVLGAANDTSNFLSVMKLANNGTTSVSSAARLGTLATTAPIASSGLARALTAVDSSGNGSFTLNGVTINYNINTDSIARVINRINGTSAGVVASYDSANDRLLLTNKNTGDTGIGALEASGGLVDALGLSAGTGGTLLHGKNALFKVNDGPTLSSTSNTLTSSVHGISGLSVTVNSLDTQTLQVSSDTATMSSSIQDFITKFNSLQSLIDTDTNITVTGSNVTTSVLSGNREVEAWGSKLQSLAFEAVGGLTGSVSRLNDLGIDFNSTSGQLVVKDSGKLATALSDHPDDVQSFFLSPTAGFVPKLFGYLTNALSSNTTEQNNITQSNTDLTTQIATIQSKLDDERTNLTNSFIAMLDAQSSAQSQQTYLTNTFFKSSTTG